MTRFDSSDIPPQNGRSAVVTGTGGLGFETALALAKAGGEVIIAGRNPLKGLDSVGRIQFAVPHARISFAQLDLASLASVAEFAARLKDQRASLDLLINNAGVMVPPVRQATTDGFELQLGTNYLGHFALTGQLLPLLRRGQGARVVSLSSVAARGGLINFDDLNARESYEPMAVYSQSKLACLMFAFELQRLCEWQGWGISSIAVHPGIARTDLLHNGPGRWSAHGLARSMLPFLFQPAAQGALPTLFAATSPVAQGGGYYGPHFMGETRGYPVAARVPPQALDETAAGRMWQISEALTGVRFEPAGAGGEGLMEPLAALQMQAA
jgi:NAD(P)-dependent dehydrogenase (short-subunit alcohol dehydrogenase family)